VSSIRALATLKDTLVSNALLLRGEKLAKQKDLRLRGAEANEVLELATSLGRNQPRPGKSQSARMVETVRDDFGHNSPELEIALARTWPPELVLDPTNREAERKAVESLLLNWRVASSIAQGLGEIGAIN